eukprot:CAMPEP_0185903238 /NCGR_PEP_ID=MMETSP0196C-20130402/2439_1 /TAXON_ID=2932 /ORGANISM="Alexandrium fundyense, Strain CCMP1719" /LENGTH=97 /DNA_ID=CAMNT_0028622237 /DNA_START=179 /DNA_END=469 /DNA_ORIENTATION=-
MDGSRLMAGICASLRGEFAMLLFVTRLQHFLVAKRWEGPVDLWAPVSGDVSFTTRVCAEATPRVRERARDLKKGEPDIRARTARCLSQNGYGLMARG